MKKLLCVSSFGGHWEQLVTIIDNIPLDETVWKKVYVTTESISMKNKVIKVRDSNFNEKMNVLFNIFEFFKLILLEKPDAVITTGAAPGFAAILVSKILGVKKRIWVDSMANAEEISKAGKYVKKLTTHRYTQWKHLADDSEQLYYLGSLL